MSLRVRRVDLLHGRVAVAEQVAEVNGRLIPGPPKTEAGRRTVTLPAAAAVALAEHLTEYAEPGPDGLVFPAPEGGYLRRSNFRRRWWLAAGNTHRRRGGAAVSIPAPLGGHAGVGGWREHAGVDGAHGSHLAGGGVALSIRTSGGTR